MAFEDTSVSRQFLPGTSFPFSPHARTCLLNPSCSFVAAARSDACQKNGEGFQKQGVLCVPAADGATVCWAEHGEKAPLAWLTSTLLDTEVFSHIHYKNAFPANPACWGNGECGTCRKGFLKDDPLVNTLWIWGFPFKVSWIALDKVLCPTRCLLQTQRN